MKTNLLLYLLLAGTVLSIQSCAPKEEKEATETAESNALKVKFETVKDTSFVHKITVQGNVETDQDILINAEMGGLITSINVKEGQTISKGTVIATVDASVLASNRAELETQLEYAKYMLKKQEQLNERGVGSEIELETAKNQVKSLESSINSIGTQQGKAVIKAPFTGVVDEVFARKGQMAGAQSPIIRLVNNSTVDIVSTISEKHLAKINIGTEMEVSFPNYGSDSTLILHVSHIGNYIEPTNRTFRVKSTIKNNKRLLPNMLAEVNITDLSVENGIVIPSASVLKDQEDNDYVFIASKNKDGKLQVRKVIIEVVERYEGETLVEGNTLKDGELIVVGGARGIVDGDIVEQL